MFASIWIRSAFNSIIEDSSKTLFLVLRIYLLLVRMIVVGLDDQLDDSRCLFALFCLL